MNTLTQPIRYAIVGCGRIARRHVKAIADTGRLVAVCDVDAAKAKDFGTEADAHVYHSLDTMLTAESDVDVVSVCTPNGLHAEHSIAALRSGKHVLCEKPMALSAGDAGRMIQEAERANRRLFVVKQNRFNPPVAAVKRVIDEGRLGKILSVQLNCFWNRNADYYQESWKGTLELDGGCLFTQFSHFIDLLYWMVGDVAAVQSFTRNFQHQDVTEFEDAGVVVLEFTCGALGSINFTTNACTKNMEGSLTIFGSQGTVKIGGQYLNELEYEDIRDYQIGEIASGNPPNQYGHYVGSMSNHEQVYANVAQVLTRDGVIATNGFEGLKTVEIIEKIYHAAQQNMGSHWPHGAAKPAYNAARTIRLAG